MRLEQPVTFDSVGHFAESRIVSLLFATPTGVDL